MIISVFRNWYIAIWEDHSYTPQETIDGITTESKWHPDCLFSRDIVFNPENQNIIFNQDTQDVDISDILPPPPKTDSEINMQIGDKILHEVFWGNPYAQLADMVKAQVITLALLVPVLGKETVKAAYADLLETVQKVSESRVSQGLEPYDLSFLD